MLLTLSFHLTAVIGWMAGLFYLPRIFVNYAEAVAAGETTTRLVLMGWRLFRFSSLLGAAAIAFGSTLWLYFGVGGAWLTVKLVLVAMLIAYQLACLAYLRKISEGRDVPGPKYFRIFNEIPVFIVFAIIFLAVVKPF